MFVSLYLQPQTSTSRWREVKPIETPPRPAQRWTGQAHQPAALHRGGQGSAGQAVRPTAERRVPEGQKLLQRWVQKLSVALSTGSWKGGDWMSFVCMEEQLYSPTSFKRQISPLGNDRLFIKSESRRISVNMKQGGLQRSGIVPVSSELPHIVPRTLAAIWSRQPERQGSYFQ